MAASPVARTATAFLALRRDQSACAVSASHTHIHDQPTKHRRCCSQGTHRGFDRMSAATCTVSLGPEFAAAPKRNVIPLVTRYGLSASGPICISFAHFVAAVICLRAFPHSAFGLFSSALVV